MSVKPGEVHFVINLACLCPDKIGAKACHPRTDGESRAPDRISVPDEVGDAEPRPRRFSFALSSKITRDHKDLQIFRDRGPQGSPATNVQRLNVEPVQTKSGHADDEIRPVGAHQQDNGNPYDSLFCFGKRKRKSPAEDDCEGISKRK